MASLSELRPATRAREFIESGPAWEVQQFVPRKPRPVPAGGPLTILAVPDRQMKPGVPLDHNTWLGRYILDRRPDVVVDLGDAYDMPSLSSWDKGMKAMENRRYLADMAAGNRGNDLLWAPVDKWNRSRRKGKQYRPRKVYVSGNHDAGRIERWLEAEPVMDGIINWPGDSNLTQHGYEVHPFLRPVEIAGVRFAHFFPRSASGRVTQTKNGAPSALTMVKREMASCVAGHTQGLDVACYQTGDRRLRGVIAGSFYGHEEPYLGEQGNAHFSGVVVMHEVYGGDFDLMEVSYDFLARRWS